MLQLYTCFTVPPQANNDNKINTCWVYVFAKVDEGKLCSPVKVGISQDVNARLASIQTSCPYPIDIAYVFEFPTKEIARSVEKSFHVVQKHKKAHGEWFSHEPGHAIHLLCLSIRAMFKARRPVENEESVLDLIGVLWAERRFNLSVPRS